MVCGGGKEDSSESQTDATCGRIQPMSDNASWTISTMPHSRTMVEGVLLLDGTVLWINGAQTGIQGFGTADDPAYEALIYDPQRHSWASGGTSTIPRLYHSVALLLRDGTVLVTGSNPNEMPLAPDETDPSNLTIKYPTEFRCEHWTPPYLQGDKAKSRPQNVTLSATSLKPGDWFTVTFTPTKHLDNVDVIMYRGGFVTHAVHMGQVMYHCENEGWLVQDGTVRVEVKVPAVKLSPGPYFVYVMANGVPSVGIAVMVEMYL